MEKDSIGEKEGVGRRDVREGKIDGKREIMKKLGKKR